jgi:cytochrome P450
LICLHHLGFDINSLGDPTNEWSTTYLSIFAEAQKPLYMLFPVIERWFLNLLPRRKRVHDECSRFQRMIDDLIESRRKAIQLAHEDEGIILQDATKEKDILTLLLESEKNEGDSNTYMTTEEIRVSETYRLLYKIILIQSIFLE